jgi:ParB-like chromosome segregation protein Spo0J
MEKVETYARLIRSGHTLVPVLMYEDENRHWLIDGRHRFLAHIITGQNKIGALVTSSLTIG